MTKERDYPGRVSLQPYFLISLVAILFTERLYSRTFVLPRGTQEVFSAPSLSPRANTRAFLRAEYKICQGKGQVQPCQEFRQPEKVFIQYPVSFSSYHFLLAANTVYSYFFINLLPRSETRM